MACQMACQSEAISSWFMSTKKQYFSSESLVNPLNGAVNNPGGSRSPHRSMANFHWNTAGFQLAMGVAHAMDAKGNPNFAVDDIGVPLDVESSYWDFPWDFP